MKTDTRDKILAYIRENKSTTAKGMAAFFIISPQALFKHLKILLESNLIGKTGAVPRVQYVPLFLEAVDTPAFRWASAASAVEPPPNWYCPTNDVWQGRLQRVAPSLLRSGFDTGAVGLIAGVIGEISDNCFTHNIFAWPDIPGCWFEIEIAKKYLRCYIADRGRGILTSLRAARPQLATHTQALLVALTERISGRLPEARGNGLKFVLAALGQLAGDTGEFIIQSGPARFRHQLPVSRAVSSHISETAAYLRGTYAELLIKI
ncbi:MAG: helix-turn-helix transcriptional regulator [Candidatus Magasanikbacteria bacterium]|nr:helix-turn-helix transcriptional regulator [Candidatus Magasanikbacteria bacterium]